MEFKSPHQVFEKFPDRNFRTCRYFQMNLHFGQVQVKVHIFTNKISHDVLRYSFHLNSNIESYIVFCLNSNNLLFEFKQISTFGRVH